jgi:hypothetical protein
MRLPDRVFLRIPGRGDAIEYGANASADAVEGGKP